MNISWIDSDGDLSVLLDEMSGCSRYAMDTEFHRERTYFPQLALIQIKHNNKIFLIDPTSVNLQLFTDLFASDSLCVICGNVNTVVVFVGVERVENKHLKR